MTGQDELAVSTYEGLLADYPRKTELYYSLVNLYARQNRLDKVIETLDEIERMVGRDETTALARYDILMHQDKAEEAFRLLTSAYGCDLAEPFVCSTVGLVQGEEASCAVAPATGEKCERCWNWRELGEDHLCHRCHDAVEGLA
jgi:pentatricopeptide repeat protein